MLTWLAAHKDALAAMASMFAMAGTVSAILIFLSGLRQYAKAERWKRLEYTAKLYTDLQNDPDAVHAIWMIDGDDREIFFEEGDERRPYKVDQVMVTKALRKYTPGDHLSPLDLHIRNCFDVFFTYIEQFDRAIQNGLVEKDDVYPYFVYWINLFNNKQHDEAAEAFRLQALGYVQSIGYLHVRRFFKRWDDRGTV